MENCQITQTYNITSPPALNDSITVQNSTCGQQNGSATVFAYGGYAPYTYLWSTTATTQTITGVASGSYTVTVTDSSGCSITDIASVSDVGGPTVATDSIVDVSCNGGSDGAIYLSILTGTGPFTYLWSTNATTEDLTGVPAGNYSLTITDQNNCQ